MRVTTSAMRPSRVSATRLAAANAMTISAAPATRERRRTLGRGAGDAGPEAAHSPQPAVIVFGFATKVFGHLRVGEDQKLFVVDSLQDDFGHGVGLERALGQEVEAKLPLGGEPVGLDPLRAEARNPQSLLAVRDRQPLEKRKGRCLRDAVWGCENVVEQTGGGNRAEEIALASLQHAWQHVTRNEDMAHQVDVPDTLPLIVGCLRPAADGDPCVGAEDVDPASLRLHLVDELLHVTFTGHVASHRRAVDLSGDGGSPFEIDVSDDHLLGSGGRKPLCEGATDAFSASGDDDDPAGNVHWLSLIHI